MSAAAPYARAPAPRFVRLRDLEGAEVALRASAVLAARALPDGGTLVLLAGGRMFLTDAHLDEVVDLLGAT